MSIMRIRHLIAASVLAVGLLAAAPAAFASAPIPNVTPNPSAPGTSTTFAVFCGTSATSATLFGTTLGLAEQIPMQATNRAGVFAVTVTMPRSISAGTYNPSIDCSNGQSTTVSVTIRAVPVQAPQTGDGTTSTATNSGLTVIGLGLVGLSAVAGGIQLLRRRRGSRA